MRKRSRTAEEAFVSGAKAEAPAAERTRAEPRKPFNLQLPESLYQRLKDYAEGPHARRDESMTGIIIRGTEKELKRLEARAAREDEE